MRWTLIRSLDFEQALRDIQRRCRHCARTGADKLGVTGFCMGGSLTYRCAAVPGGFDAAAGFYGAFIAAASG